MRKSIEMLAAEYRMDVDSAAPLGDLVDLMLGVAQEEGHEQLGSHEPMPEGLQETLLEWIAEA